jgi:hypothetical protein
LPINFSVVEESDSTLAAFPPQSGLCCPGTSCYNQKLILGGNCFCSDAEPSTSTQSVNDCNDSDAYCSKQEVEDYLCPDNEHTCTNFFLTRCATSPPPTPTPTPTPSPTPCDPDPATRPNPSCYPFGPCPPQGTRGWSCDPCSGPIVHYPAYPQTNGCPDGYYNNGTSNCCVPVSGGGGAARNAEPDLPCRVRLMRKAPSPSRARRPKCAAASAPSS